MRIDTLDLRAFGPFTAKPLDFSQGKHGLHVVFGQNEAGKSSALRALGAALFGIHGQTKDDFVHEYSALRLAMSLRNAKDERISFVRRKARSKPLWDAEESSPLSDDALRSFLGGINTEEFERAYGLDHLRLREGSDRLLDAAEGADAAIVGAALGVNDLRAVRAAIEAEAAALFAARGTKPAINSDIAEWKGFQKDLRDCTLSAHAWTEARRGLDRSVTQRDEAVALEKELRGRCAELEFVRRNRTRVSRLIEPRAKLEEFASVPDLAKDFSARLRNADSARREASFRLDRSREEEETARGELEPLYRDFALVDREAEVAQLREFSIESAKGVRDRERLRAKADSASSECDRLATELGLTAPLAESTVVDLGLALGAEERCEELVREHTRITISRKEAERRLGSLGRERTACEERLAAPQDSIDPAPLASAVTAALRLGTPDADLAALRADLEESDRALAKGLEYLPGFAGDVEELASRPVPGPESLAKFGQRFSEADEEDRDARRKGDELRGGRSQTDADIDRLSSQEAVPSEEDLTDLRGRRDGQWRLVRKAWIDGADVEVEAREFDADRPLVESFGRSIEQSDDVADRMRRESERVVQLAEFRRRREQAERQLSDLEDANRELLQRREELARDWREAWTNSGLEARDPAAMKDALTERAQLIDLSEGRRDLVRKIAELEERMAAAHADLAAAMVATGASTPGDETEGALAPMLQISEERRDALTKVVEARRLDEQNLERVDRELGDEQIKQTELETEQRDWRTAFDAATRGLPRRADDPPDDVTRVLRHVRTLVTHRTEVVSLHDRIEKIDADAADLVRQLQEFRIAHAPDLPAEEPADSIARLVALVEESKRGRHAYDMATKQLEKTEENRKKADAAVEIVNRTLGDLAQEAGASSVDDLSELVRRADEKRDFREELERVRDDLLSEGCSIEETERRVAAQDGVDIEAELKPLEAELEQASHDAELKRDAATLARLEVEGMEGETGAGEIAEKAASVAARLRDDVERYARLVLSARLLSSAVERFRERNEAPMLRYASGHLAGITRGRYRRVETDIDDSGKPFFLIREASGAPAKTLEKLSDGTRDQLYLALVLGSLNHRIESGAEPMPLVLDDVLVHFDDERSMAALEALAAFSRTTQVLLFTHHERIREQAESLRAGGQTFVCDI